MEKSRDLTKVWMELDISETLALWQSTIKSLKEHIIYILNVVNRLKIVKQQKN